MKALLLVFYTIFLLSCNNYSIESKWLVPIDSASDITTNQLMKNGFKHIKGVDVLLYEKVIEDTLYGFQFSTKEFSADENGVGFQYWRVLKSLNSQKEITDFLAANELYIVTGDIDTGRFVVVNGSNNAVLVCDLINKNYLNLVYYHKASN